MTMDQTREATLGMLTYLLIGAAVAVTLLLGTVLVGLEGVSDALGGSALHDWIQSGDAFLAFVTAFLIFLPLAALGVAALMGRRAAMTGNAVGAPAAVTTFFGVLVAWLNVSIALIVASLIIGVEGTRTAYAEVLDLVFEGFLFIGLGILPLLGLATLAARFTRDAFSPGAIGLGAASAAPVGADVSPAAATTSPDGWAAAVSTIPALAPASGTTVLSSEPSMVLDSHGVTCPRCNGFFTASGARPLRIECPACGKTGTLR